VPGMRMLIEVEGRTRRKRRRCRRNGRRRVGHDHEQPAKPAQRLDPHEQSLPPPIETHQERLPTEGEDRSYTGHYQALQNRRQPGPEPRQATVMRTSPAAQWMTATAISTAVPLDQIV
jgi:hypothetical protein